MSANPSAVVLFDWNGTVVLDADRARAALNTLLARRDRPRLDEDGFRREFRLPMSEMFVRLEVHDVVVAEAEWNDSMAQTSTEARDGLAALHRLRDEGVRLGVVSAASTHAVQTDINALGLDGLWDSVDAPSADKLAVLMDRRGREHRAFYLGDTPYDMACALAAGYIPIGVDRGYVPTPELTAAGATAIIRSFDELPHLLTQTVHHSTSRTPDTRKESIMSTALRLHPLEGGYMNGDRSLVHLGDSGPIAMPLPTFLIEHDKGLVLIDTGMRPAAWTEGPLAVYGAVHEMFPFDCPPGASVDQQINKAGFAVEDVTHVIVTHAHLDHVGGLYLFPDAEIYISEDELAYLENPHPFFAGLFGHDDLAKVPESAWRKITTDHDLFDDGSIQLLRTPGHTPGQLSILVKLPTQNFMIVGDAVHTHTNMAGIPCPVDLDAETAYRSVERIKAIAESENAEIWVMHDPEQWQKLGYAETPYS